MSAYKACHSCETALLRDYNNIVITIGKGNGSFLVLLDLSAAFDSINHDNIFMIVVAVELVPQRVNRRRSFSTLMLTLGNIVLVRLASNIIRYGCNGNIFIIFRKSFFDKVYFV